MRFFTRRCFFFWIYPKSHICKISCMVAICCRPLSSMIFGIFVTQFLKPEKSVVYVRYWRMGSEPLVVGNTFK